MPLLVSGYPEDEKNTLYINHLARIYGGKLKKGVQNIDQQMYVLASTGKIKVSDKQMSIVMHKGDGAEISKQKRVTIAVLGGSAVILIGAPVN